MPYDNPLDPPKVIVPIRGSASPTLSFLRNLNTGSFVEVLPWGDLQERKYVKDSCEFKETDLVDIAGIVMRPPFQNFIITHGTDCLIKNAGILKRNLMPPEKVVIFAGAMVPLSMNVRHQSDAPACLSYVTKIILTSLPGVWVAGIGEPLGNLGFSIQR